MSRFVLSSEARSDLKEIQNYIAEDSTEAARRVLAGIRNAIRELARMPRMGHRRTDLTKKDVLFWPTGPYLIIYRVEHSILQVVVVLHGRRNVRRLLLERLKGF